MFLKESQWIKKSPPTQAGKNLEHPPQKKTHQHPQSIFNEYRSKHKSEV